MAHRPNAPPETTETDEMIVTVYKDKETQFVFSKELNAGMYYTLRSKVSYKQLLIDLEFYYKIKPDDHQ